ncbi:MAG: hypothetical protein WCT03_06640 [Candidatus Obscuribacterales bacterium]|jgi:hypothetical protein
MKLSLVKVPAVLLLLICTNSIFATAALAEAPAITPSEMVIVIRNAKIVTADAPVRASLINQEAIITTKRNPKANDKDCKIEAIMIGKVLVDTYSKEILRVKVLFSDYENQKYTSVSLSKGDLTAFGDGKLNQDELLNSLQLTTFKEDVSPFSDRASESGTTTGISPGPLLDKRLLLLSRIESLKQKGTNVKAYMDYFNTIEDAVKNSDEEKVKSLSASLSEKLNDQEKMRQQAQVTGLKNEVLRFQTHIQQHVLSGKKLPFDLGQIQRVQQLVVAGKNAEAKALMDSLERTMR